MKLFLIKSTSPLARSRQESKAAFAIGRDSTKPNPSFLERTNPSLVCRPNHGRTEEGTSLPVPFLCHAIEQSRHSLPSESKLNGKHSRSVCLLHAAAFIRKPTINEHYHSSYLEIFGFLILVQYTVEVDNQSG